MITTRFTSEYLEFRNTLNNDQLLNLRNKLKNMLQDEDVRDHILTVLELGGAILFHVYIDKASGTVWILGGHWVRQGEPSKEFLARMHRYAAEILRGEEPQ